MLLFGSFRLMNLDEFVHAKVKNKKHIQLNKNSIDIFAFKHGIENCSIFARSNNYLLLLVMKYTFYLFIFVSEKERRKSGKQIY